MRYAVARMVGLCAVAAMVGVPTAVQATGAPLYTYEVLLDTDNNMATGGMVPVVQAGASQNVEGIDYIVRVRAGFEFGTPTFGPALLAMVPQVLERRVFKWDGIDFMPVDTDPSMYPLGTADNGAQVEFGASLAVLGMPQGTIRGVFHASRADLDQNDYTAPFVLHAHQAPTLSVVGLVVLGFLLLLVGMRLRGRRPRQLALGVAAGLSVASIAWAATIVLDGNFTDWAGVPPIVTDPRGDSSKGDPNEDILAGYVTRDAATMFFRMDLAGLMREPG